MLEWKEYYKRSIQDKPSIILNKFFEMNLKQENKNALDLGCGSGNDTIWLANRGYKVTAIDKQKEVIDAIKSRGVETSKIDFIIEPFENIKLGISKYGLVISNFGLPFCKPQQFNDVCKKVTDSIEMNGYFVGNFLGEDDGWKNDLSKTFVSENAIKEIFKEYNILYFKEKKYNKKTAKGLLKFWHVYEIIAKKSQKNRKNRA